MYSTANDAVNDEAGRAYAEKVASILTGLEPPATVKVVELPGLPPEGDVADWLEILDFKEPADLRQAIEESAETTIDHTMLDGSLASTSPPLACSAAKSWSFVRTSICAPHAGHANSVLSHRLCRWLVTADQLPCLEPSKSCRTLDIGVYHRRAHCVRRAFRVTNGG